MCETATHLIVCVEDPTGMELKTDNNCEAVRIDDGVKMCSDPAGMWLFETFYLPFLSWKQVLCLRFAGNINEP